MKGMHANVVHARTRHATYNASVLRSFIAKSSSPFFSLVFNIVTASYDAAPVTLKRPLEDMNTDVRAANVVTVIQHEVGGLRSSSMSSECASRRLGTLRNETEMNTGSINMEVATHHYPSLSYRSVVDC